MGRARPIAAELAAARLTELLPQRGRAVHVDLGTGLAHFLVTLAQRHPETVWVGLEHDAAVAAKAARRLERAGLDNACIVRRDARAFLLESVDTQGIDHLWINFPDPWPKDRHAARRHSDPWMLGLLIDRLRIGGELHLRTDEPDYFAAFAAAMQARADVTAAADSPWRRDNVAADSKYERKWAAAGKTPQSGDWRRIAPGDAGTYDCPIIAAPQFAPLRLLPPGVRRDGNYLLKVFPPLRAEPRRQRFLLVDTAHGIETPGELSAGNPSVLLLGAWTPWKRDLLNAALAAG